MQFDHIPEKVKSFELGKAANKGYSLAKIKDEALKCEVVCANCHAIRTFNRNNSRVLGQSESPKF